MKNLSILLAGVALVAFTFTSCKKEYDCTCTVSVLGYDTVITTPSGVKMKKADAQAWCDTGDSAYSVCELD